MTKTSVEVVRADGSSANPLPNGYYKLPPGKLANACTYLEMLAPPASPRLFAPEGVHLARLSARDAIRFLELFRAIGEMWLWAGHLRKSGEQVAQLLDDPTQEIFAAASSKNDVGLLQLHYDKQNGAEVVYFGVVSDVIGTGVGRWLMGEAVARAFARPVQRLWLHTCNFDHPNALRFYRSAGFTIFATGFEIMDDPRVLGVLPRSAAPHVPMAT